MEKETKIKTNINKIQIHAILNNCRIVEFLVLFDNISFTPDWFLLCEQKDITKYINHKSELAT